MSRFTWTENGVEEANVGIHEFKPYPEEPKKILNNVSEAFGRTPLVRLQRIPQQNGVVCNVYGKCEFFNASGSAKDRAVGRWLELQRKSGKLTSKSTLLISTSGNTGIALAVAAVVHSLPCICVVPAKMSAEKETVLKALGAQVVRVDASAGYDGRVAELRRLEAQTENALVFEQYDDVANALSHYESTAEEILEALNGKVDLLVGTVGTGGCLAGIARKIKQKSPNCKVVAVVPEDPESAVEDIGLRAASSSLADSGLIDEWQNVSDAETYALARQLSRDEALLCGETSGTALAAALRSATSLRPDQNCVFLMPDGIRNYMTKFPNAEWMQRKGFAESGEPPLDLFPQLTFDTAAEYDPEADSAAPHQWVAEPWPTRARPSLRPLLLQNIAGAIGWTPLVKLQRIPQSLGIEAEVLVKCEYLNAGGSVKDRIAQRMVELAEDAGILRSGMTVIEPTSGNTGIGLALICAIRGYRCIIVMPKKMSKEKEWTLRALGAEIVRTDTHHHYTSPDSHIGVALRLQREIDGAIILDQERNVGNPLAHYETTAEEILWACDGHVDAIVIGAGTGGTITGVAKKLKQRLSNVKIVCVDPEGSILADPSDRTTHSYDLEGLGYDFVPAILKRPLVDEWIKSNDADSFAMARRLIREEALLVGGSSGANVTAALSVAKQLGPGKRVVTVLPDGVRNYLSKFVDDSWMTEKGFAIA